MPTFKRSSAQLAHFHAGRRFRFVLTTVLLACACLMSCQASAQANTSTDTIRTSRVNGYDFAYAERGAAVPVVLVHGSLNDYRSWAAQMAPLGERYRVIALSSRTRADWQGFCLRRKKGQAMPRAAARRARS